MKIMMMACCVMFVVVTSVFAGKADVYYPTAILTFQERGDAMKGQGANVADIVFAGLAVQDNLVLVERQNLDKLLDEAMLSLSGVVDSREAIQIGQLSGATILVTGSAFQVGKTTYLTAKIIGTETALNSDSAAHQCGYRAYSVGYDGGIVTAACILPAGNIQITADIQIQVCRYTAQVRTISEEKKVI